jgi:tetratricopeptide (TPR) repeat protein
VLRRSRIRLGLGLGLGICACVPKAQKAAPPDAAPVAVAAPTGGTAPSHAVVAATVEKKAAEGKDRPRPPVAPCPVTDKGDVDAALDEAAHRFDAADYLVALSCAEQAGRASPLSVEAQHDRADALAALERLDEAKDGYALALALDPDDPQTLAAASDFYINRLPPESQFASIGLAYARRGSAHVGRRREDRELAARLALLESEALDDLGRADEALPRVEAALEQGKKSVEARYQRALILFHLCKMDAAEKAFNEVLELAPDDAFAHHHLGLVLERKGKQTEADAHLARAQAIAPTQFPAPVIPPMPEFRKMVDDAVGALDPATHHLLDGVNVEVVDVPDLTDLTAVDPPFPPTILGLYRGAPIGEPANGEKRAIVLYRKNLGRAVTTRAELVEQVRITVLHEIGHLTGADDDDLKGRGLE